MITSTTRRTFLQTLGSLPLAAATAWPQAPRRYDLLIRNGEVLDPARSNSGEPAAPDGPVGAQVPSVGSGPAMP